MSTRRARPSRTSNSDRLMGRLRELEDRISALEARLSTQVALEPAALKSRLKAKRRCPGCLLELPKGRKGPSCVWCGFYFEAVKAQAAE